MDLAFVLTVGVVVENRAELLQLSIWHVISHIPYIIPKSLLHAWKRRNDDFSKKAMRNNSRFHELYIKVHGCEFGK